MFDFPRCPYGLLQTIAVFIFAGNQLHLHRVFKYIFKAGEQLEGALKIKDSTLLVSQMRNPRQKDLEAELRDLLFSITVVG